MQVVNLKIYKLKSYKSELRKHSENAVIKTAEAIKEFGFKVPILAKANGEIIDGHLRYKAALFLKLVSVPVLPADDLTDLQIKAFRLSVNKLSEFAEWNFELLKLELEELQKQDFDLSLTSFSDEDIEALLLNSKTKKEDKVPDNVETKTQQGDIWQLGGHLIMCGNAASSKDVNKLMQGNKAGCVFTSPPYAMQRKSSYGGISVNDYPAWFLDISKQVWNILENEGSFFVNIKEHVEDGQRSLYVFRTIENLVNFGWRYVDQLIWAKPGMPGKWANRLKNSFEPIHFFTKKDGINWFIQEVEFLDNADPYFINQAEDIFHFTKQKKIKFRPNAVGNISKDGGKKKAIKVKDSNTGNIGQVFKVKAGIARPGNVINIQGNQESFKHPAMFPVGLPEFFIKLTTQEKDIVYEPFSGAGSTLIACEKTGRYARAMEILPEYVDLAVERWEQFTGKKAVRL